MVVSKGYKDTISKEIASFVISEFAAIKSLISCN